MLERNALERLQDLNDDFEIWWDSSPLVFSAWKEEYIADNPTNTTDENLRKHLDRLYVEEEPEKSLFRGVTTNPRLTRETLDWIPEEWEPWIKNLKDSFNGASLSELAWRTYENITEEGAQRYLPIFEKSNYKYGYVSSQVDPRLLTDTRKMLGQAIGLKALSPNIMIKSPATKEGIYNIMLLTSLGIPTNATVCFTIPQVVAVAEAVKKGKEIGEKNGVDYSKWRSVITLMLGRFEEREPYAKQFEEKEIEFTEELRHWSGIAIGKKAIKILNENNYPSKILLCSSRLGPKENGNQKIWHIEKFAGEPIVYTINPSMIGDFIKYYEDHPLEDNSDKDVPEEVLGILMQIPYFRKGYSVFGMQPDEFIDHPSSIYTADGFSDHMELLEKFVDKV